MSTPTPAFATSKFQKRSHVTSGHSDCGIYAEVVNGGEIAQGDNIEIT
jgi:MOSC domain-containing protein YiiM